MILKYLINILSAVNGLNVADLELKMKSTVKLSILLSPFAFITELISAWSIANKEFILVVLGAIIVDHVLGSFKHAFVLRDFVWKKNITGLMTKIGLVTACGFLFEALQIIIHEETFVTEYLKTITRLIVFLYPAGSAFSNSSIISGGKFPPSAWLVKLKKFQSNLNPNEFGNNNQNKK